MEKNGSPLPEFITDADHSYFVTRLFVKDSFDGVTEDESYLLSEKGDKKGLKKNDEILQRMDAILQLISSKSDRAKLANLSNNCLNLF